MALLAKITEGLLILLKIIGWMIEWAYRKILNEQAIIEPSENHIETEASVLQWNETPHQTASATTTAEIALKDELIEQKKLAKNVYVRGISRDLHINNPEEIFLKLCEKLGVVINRDDIQKIDQISSGIVVTLHNLDTKSYIINQTLDRHIWCSELLELGPRIKQPWKIFVQNHMTRLFHKIWVLAHRLAQENRLHSVELTDDGIVVKRSPSDNGRVILSEKELFDYIKKE